MLMLLGPLRRHRLLLGVLGLFALFFIFGGYHHDSNDDRERVRTGGLGTNTWGDTEWSDDFLVKEQLGPRPQPFSEWMKWKNKSGKTILVTGGAGALAHALIARLVEHKYTVHAADIVAQPATLPKEVNYHRLDITGNGLPELIKLIEFDGIVHFAGISLEQWCAPKHADCERINVGGTKALLTALDEAQTGPRGGLIPWKGKKERSPPWLIFGSSTDVYGNTEKGMTAEGSPTEPTTWIGKTKLAAEEAIREHFSKVDTDDVTGHTHDDDDLDSAPAQSLRGAILRFSDVYGYPRVSNVPAAFIPRLIQNAVSSLPIQYNSDLPPMDLLNVKDAVQALIHVIDHLEEEHKNNAKATLDVFNIVKGGKRWKAQEIVEIVRTEVDTESPLRDIGDQKSPRQASEYSNRRAREVLDWSPSIEFPYGFAMAMLHLAEEVSSYTQNFVDSHCPQFSNVLDVPELPEDARNRDLYKLHNCTVNIGFDNSGFMHHIKCEDGKNCLADDERVKSYNWNATVWIVHVTENKRKSNRHTTVRFKQENGMGWLGLRKEDIQKGGEVKWEMFKDDDKTPHVDTFDIEVAPDNSILRVMLPGKAPQQQIAAVSKGEKTEFHLQTPAESHYDMRLAMLCCEREGDWPLLLDDHESADIRFGDTGQIAFNASRRLHLCDRAQASHTYSETMVGKLKETAELVKTKMAATTRPKQTTKNPDNWALKELPPCWNDCNSPTICVQTGNCKCVQADSCARRRENPLIALGRGIHPTSKPSFSPLGTLGGYDTVLEKLVKKTDWRDILLTEARDYLHYQPNFIKIHVVDKYPRQEAIEAAECHKLQKTHCFSADSIMYKAMRHLSGPADEADLIVLPVYQHCDGAEFILHDVWRYASETIKGINEQTKSVSLMMTHDWGICLAFTWEIWESRVRNKDNGKPALYPDPIMKNALVWSVMGDWDSRCYRPAQDVVVPARTCLSKKLVARFEDMTNVQPARQRVQLINWAGTYWGTGKSERLRLACHRGGVSDEELVPGGGPQSIFADYEDYMGNLNGARFCPQPRGIAGWSPRVNDAIYAGCIPILLAEGSHYPFASILDWSQFSVRIHPTELDHIEQILNDIPLERVEQMQANLMAIRDAFLYATDEHPEAELKRRGPMFFALHEAGMRMRTQYPDRHAK